MRKQIEGQLSLFDFIPKPEPKSQWVLPCDTCGYDIKGCCDYDYHKNNDYCVLGDKWIPKNDSEMTPGYYKAPGGEDAQICKHSGHNCNKKELWKIADTLDETMCPHVCCRSCNTRLCGARCNGSEEPIALKAGDYVDIHGERVMFEDIEVNHYYISDYSTQHHKWFKVIYVKWKKNDAVGYVDAPKGVNGKWSWGNNHSALSRKMYINADRNTASGEADTSGWMYRLPIEGVKQCE